MDANRFIHLYEVDDRTKVLEFHEKVLNRGAEESTPNRGRNTGDQVEPD